MKNKGFTMVELLAVISILAIVILIAVPTFGSVRDRTNQSIYESKIASVKASAEAYSEETGEIAFDVGTLISQGKLEADNESGEYRNPVNGEDMRCYAVEVRYENLQYYANVHETSRCLSQDELQNLYGAVKIQAFKSDGNPLTPVHENWYNESLMLGYELKKTELASQVEQITWVGDRSITCTKEAGNLDDCTYYGGSLLGSAGSIQTMKVSLEITFKLENGAIFRDRAQKQLLIDMEGPRVVSVEASPGATDQSGKRVEIEMTDGNGSGLKEYRVVKVASENDVPTCKNLDGYRSVEQSKMVEYLDNGWYYTCVRDNALNDNQDTVAQTKKQVTGVDYSQVNGASLTVENKDENTPMKVKATITIPSTEDASKLKMCVSNTGHLKDCSWEAFKSSFDWTFPGHADCVNRTLYVSISDEVGNITNLVNNPYSPHSIAKYDGNGIELSATNAKKSVCYGGNYSIPTVTREGHTLSGWFTAKSGGTQLKNTDKVNYDGVKTFYARWTVNKYYLDLNGLLDGTSSGNISGYGTADVYIGVNPAGNDITDYYTQHPYGTTYEIKDIKASTGHTSEGVSSGAVSGKVGAGGKNTIVQLKFKTNTYTVSWNGNGGSVTKNGATSVKYNTAVGTLGTATRTGYTFKGWFTAASGGTQINASTKITGNVTFYAQWNPITYAVTFNANGGTGAPGNQTKYYGTNLTLSSTKPSRASYNFTGWNTKADGTGTSYASGGTYTANSAVTLYAQWKLAGYTITWNGNGGNVNGKTSTTSIVNVGSTLGTLPTATRSNYQFLGWFTKSSSTDANIASVTTSTKPSGNTTYYALWSAVLADSKYSYTLNTNCGTGCTSSNVSSTKDYGTYYLVPGDKVTVRCYNTRHSGTNFWDALSKNRVPLQWYGPRSGASTTLTFTYDGSQNGTWSCDKYYYEYAGSNSERQLNYYKQNYASVQAGAGYMGSSGSTCYGQCDRVTFQSGHNYVVKWVDYGKTTVQILNGGNPITLLPQVSRDTTKYSFQGWFTGPNGTGSKLSDGWRTPQSDVTYYAYWITITGVTHNFVMKTTPPIANYGNQYVSIGDKVTISCYNQKAPGTYYKNHLLYNGNLIASGSNRKGASASVTFLFDGTQTGYYECGLTWSEYHRFENYSGKEGMNLLKK